jgi:hypothetical protein
VIWYIPPVDCYESRRWHVCRSGDELPSLLCEMAEWAGMDADRAREWSVEYRVWMAGNTWLRTEEVT